MHLKTHRPIKRRRPTKDIERELHAIYRNRDGNIPDLSKLERRRKKTITFYLFRILLFFFVLTILGWGSFLIFKPYHIQKTESLTLEIETPEIILAGDEVFYHIVYKNPSSVDLSSLQIQVHLPKNFLVTSTRPASPQQNIWAIGSVSAGSDGSIDIGGIHESSLPAEQTIQAIASYKPANGSSDFQKIASKRVSLETSALLIDLVGPEKSIPGDEVSYTITLKNSGKKTLEKTQVRFLAPETFSLASANPEPSQPDVLVWNLEPFAPEDLKEIILTGSFTSTASGTLPLKAEIGFMNQEGEFLLQNSREYNTDLLGGNMLVYLIANGSSEQQTILPGENLRLSLDYQNKGTEAVQDITFSLHFQPSSDKTLPIDWLLADLSGGRREGNTLTWDKNTTANLAMIEAEGAGVIDIVLPITKQVKDTADQFTLELSTTIQVIADLETSRTLETSPLLIKLNSDAEFFSFARFYDEQGNIVGSGPLPAKVGQTTTYRVYWEVRNSLHALENGIISTSLPPHVTWTGKASSDMGTIVFNETTRMITWNITQLPTSLSRIGAWFDVSVTPKQADIGTFLKLINPSAFEIKDKTTTDFIHFSSEMLDTELPEDRFAKGKGVVEEDALAHK